jgi:peptidoglycan/LPS O-acetylase OafA/YrhL
VSRSLNARYPNLDILRIFLALEVIVLHTHAYDTGQVLWLPIHPVATFVCISGLLIPHSFSTSNGWPHFAWKRLLRVGPALTVALLLVMSLFGRQAAWGTFLFYLTAGLVGAPGFDGPLWSLAVEEVLYAGHAITRAIRGAWRVETVALLFIVSCAMYTRWSPGHQNLERYLRLSSAFFLGNVASFYKERLRRVSPYWVIVSFATALLFINFGGLSLMLYMVADSVVCASVVIFALSTPQVKFKVHDISYGTYVYHAPILALYVSRFHLHHALLWLTAVPTVLCLATLSWFFIEHPALRFKDALIKKTNVKDQEPEVERKNVTAG